MTPAEQLLVSCCLPPMAAARHGVSTTVQSQAPSAAVWSATLARASELDVGPLVASTALARLATALPADIAAQCRAMVYANGQRNVRLLSDLRRLHSLLSASGVTAVPFKGVWLAQRVYGGLAPRRIGDLDLVIPSGQMALACETLLAAGLRCTDPSLGTATTGPRLDLVGEGWAAGTVYVELHQAAAFADYWRGDEQALWREVRPDAEWGAVFSAELTLAHLALHWHQHGFDLRTLVDYAWAAEALSACLSPCHFRSLINELGLRTVVRMADRVAWAGLGASLPAWACPSPTATALAKFLPIAPLVRPRDRTDEDRVYLLQTVTGPHPYRWLWRWLVLPTAAVRRHHRFPDDWPAWRVQFARFTRGLQRAFDERSVTRKDRPHPTRTFGPGPSRP